MPVRAIRRMDAPPKRVNPEARLRAAFRALVERQDRGQSVAGAERDVRRVYGLTEGELTAVVARGMREWWEPLVRE